MTRLLAARRRDRPRGQALVEFALVLPMFVVLLFGIIDVGRYVYSTNSLNEVARESARMGAVALRPDTCSALSRTNCVKTIAGQRLIGVQLDAANVSVICQRKSSGGALPATEMTDNCAGSWRANDFMRVRITREFTLLTPVIGQLIGNLTMNAEAFVTVNG